MTTTIMRDSVIGDQWIYEAVQSTPIYAITDPTTGQPDGNFCTGPVRLSFCNLFEPGTSTDDDGNKKEGKFGTTVLFTPYHDFTLLNNEVYRMFGLNFYPDYYDAATQRYYGLNSPFRDQAEKMKFGGFTPGCQFITCTSNFRPPIVDIRMNPIVDPARVYAGVWAILSINAWAYGKNPVRPKKGVSFGVQSVMIIADDTPLGGGAPDPKTQFGGVNVKPPAGAPTDYFSHSGAPAQPPGAPAGPPAYPGAPSAPAQPPAAPGGGFTPPAAPLPGAPGQTPPTSAPASTAPTPPFSAPSTPTTSPSSEEDLSFLG